MSLLIEPLQADTEVLSVADECPEVKTFRLSVPQGFAFAPGMFVMVSFPDAPKVSRAYSISSAPQEKGHIEITLNKVGDFTARLFAAGPGARLHLKGPYGKWVFTDDVERAALISGGTGITPFRSMIRYALAKGLPKSLSLFCTAKTPSEFVYRRELAAFARKGVHVHAAITRPQNLPPGETWSGPVGRVTAALLKEKLPDFAATVFFICGPNALVKGLASDLAALGIPKDQIRYEKWGDYSF